MRFSILGPLEVFDDAGTEIRLVGKRRRALVVRLLISQNTALEASQLAEDIWDGTPPAGASSTLQSHLSLIRKSLGRDRVQGGRPSVSLRVDAGELDAGSFELEFAQASRAFASGDAGTAVQLLDEALGRWRGAALFDVVGTAWALPERARLEGLRVAALEMRLEARLALGDHVTVASEAEVLTTEHPLREHLWAILMLALYRSGRQAEALRAYSRLRRILGEELGIEPSVALSDLEDAIILQKPHLDIPRPPLPKPTGLGMPATSLPSRVTTFVGRSRELEALAELTSTTRLVTIAGPGGTGKTRICLELAEHISLRAGVAFVELADVPAGASVTAAVAQALNLGPQAEESADRIAEAIGDSTMTIMLDNCEQVLGACASLTSKILAVCRHISVVTTSRQPLGIDGEHVYRLSPLSLPPEGAAALELISAAESVVLFVDRAKALRSDWQLDATTAATVATICRRVDGIPLAVELAAGRMGSLALADVADRLDRRLSLLARSEHTAVPRHKTLRALLDWSYDLLTAEEKLYWGYLSVFVGGWTLSEAETFAGYAGLSIDVLAVTSSLVSKSLLQSEATGSTGRFRLLELMREYAAEQLAKTSSDVGAAQRAHATTYRMLLTTQAQVVRSPRCEEAVIRIRAERDNLRTAFTYIAAEPDTAEEALDMAIAWRNFWSLGFACEAEVAILDTVLARGDAGVATSKRADALHASASAFNAKNMNDRIANLTECQTLAEAIGDPRLIAISTGRIGKTDLDRGFGEGFAASAETAVAEALRSGDANTIAWALNLRALSFAETNPAKARRDYRQALAKTRDSGQIAQEAYVLHDLGWFEMTQGRFDVARQVLEQAAMIGRPLFTGGMWSALICDLAVLTLLQGDVQRATTYLHEALGEERRASYSFLVPDVVAGLAACAVARGEPMRGATLYGAADSLSERLGASIQYELKRLRDRDLSVLRAGLGDLVVNEAYEVGTLMRTASAYEYCAEPPCSKS